MKNLLSRRKWIKSAAVIGAGIPLSLTIAEQLMAAPVSHAEKLHGINRPGKLIRLGSNENPYGPSPRAREAIRAAITEYNRYSFSEAQEFKKVLADKEGGAVLSAYPTYQAGAIINQAALAAARASLGDVEFMNFTRKKNAEARDYFCRYLDSRKWFYGKSHANVVLFPAPKDGKTILEETERRGFQIRIWDYQDKEWCRVSIGTLEEMKAFTKAFDEVISL